MSTYENNKVDIRFFQFYNLINIFQKRYVYYDTIRTGRRDY